MPRALSKSFYVILLFILITANICLYQEIFAPRVLKVMVLEIGKGDAILIRTSNKKTLLIDTGPDAGILRALGTSLPEWQKTINAIALTSSKTSSVGGLSEVLQKYRVQTILHFGTDIPYGTSFALDSTRITIIAPDTVTISYGSTSLSISSTTPAGTFISDGKK
jgi:competence protein ComEC